MRRIVGAWAELPFNPTTWKEDAQARKNRFDHATPIEPAPTTVTRKTIVVSLNTRQESAVAPAGTPQILPKLKRTPENIIKKTSEVFYVDPAAITTTTRGRSEAGVPRGITCLLLRDLAHMTPREIAPLMGYGDTGYHNVYLRISNVKKKLRMDTALMQRVQKIIAAFEPQ